MYPDNPYTLQVHTAKPTAPYMLNFVTYTHIGERTIDRTNQTYSYAQFTSYAPARHTTITEWGKKNYISLAHSIVSARLSASFVYFVPDVNVACTLLCSTVAPRHIKSAGNCCCTRHDSHITNLIGGKWLEHSVNARVHFDRWRAERWRETKNHHTVERD